ncbi:MAG: diacylglycerol kinase family lipid kinase [Verrucomicrobia bacterium]|nr:diacylglycerol kinase family lipid kinase [Verrucomicrobiota bacterium]
MQQDWRLIGNPQAGAGRTLKLWSQLVQRFPEAAGLRVHWTRASGEATAVARAAAGQCAMVVAVGGDGTANEVATGLIEAGVRETVLGLLPLGTGNDAARALGLEDPVEAWTALAKGPTRSMDVIEVRCETDQGVTTRYSLVYAAAGIAAEILERTTARVKYWAGRRGCYTVGFLRALAGWRSPEMRIRCAGREYAGRFMVVSAGNAEWVGGGMMRLSPGARWDDGLLNINLIPRLNGWQALRSFPRLYRGTHLHLRGVRYLTAPELELESDPPTRVQVDGDVCGATPARFRVLPGRLRVKAAAA